MAVVRILSAGAAQSVVEQVARAYTGATGNGIKAEFGAVGAMQARVIDGEAVDVIVLTAALIDEFVAAGHVAPGTRADLGTVGTGVAVRFGTPLPDVSSKRTLRGNLLAAKTIVCPDPAIATAGKVVMRAVKELGIVKQAQPKLRHFPNGHAAMKWLAESTGLLEIGITQVTEIRAYPGVTYVGPLPGDLQVRTLYAAGLAARAAEPKAGAEFVDRLTSPATRSILANAGYEFD